jgi:hypothetical protein
MADPLSIAASLIAVLELTTKIISSCHKYRCGVQRAQKDIGRILDEAKVLRDVLEEVIRLLEEGETEGTANAPSLRKMNLAGGLFSELLSDLSRLETRLRPSTNKWKRLGDKLLWPLQESDVKRALDSIQRLRGIVQVGLAVDSAASIMAMRKDMTDLKLRVIQLQTSPFPEQELRMMLDWLGGPDHFEPHQHYQQRIAEGTTNWLISNNQFEAWRDTPSSVLWLRGVPGSGKSVLSSAVIEHLQTYEALGHDAAIAYYYFSFEAGQSQSVAMLRSLITQLSAWNGQPPDSLARCARRLSMATSSKSRGFSGQHTAQPSRIDLIRVLHGILNEYSRTYIVLDGLHEVADQQELIGILHAILSVPAHRCSIFLASRPYESLGLILESKASHLFDMPTNPFDEFEYIGFEIDQMVERRLEELKKKHPRSSRLLDDLD